jgi:hypothetical protein
MNNSLPSLDHALPATEWANDATSALGDTQQRSEETVFTAHGPSSNFPGAFPGGEGTLEPLAGKGGIIDAVRQSLPAQQDVVETAKQYLPAPVAAYLRRCLAKTLKL